MLVFWGKGTLAEKVCWEVVVFQDNVWVDEEEVTLWWINHISMDRSIFDIVDVHRPQKNWKKSHLCSEKQKLHQLWSHQTVLVWSNLWMFPSIKPFKTLDRTSTILYPWTHGKILGRILIWRSTGGTMESTSKYAAFAKVESPFSSMVKKMRIFYSQLNKTLDQG